MGLLIKSDKNGVPIRSFSKVIYLFKCVTVLLTDNCLWADNLASLIQHILGRKIFMLLNKCTKLTTIKYQHHKANKVIMQSEH